MDRQIVVRLHSSFEDMVRRLPNTNTEFWFARDLQMLLGYVRWENFAKVVDKAMTACQNAGHDPKDHFLGITKMVDLGSGAKRAIEDIGLTRYACCLIALNGDPAPYMCNVPTFLRVAAPVGYFSSSRTHTSS
jgi:DNA-damage-inducible protein D